MAWCAVGRDNQVNGAIGKKAIILMASNICTVLTLSSAWARLSLCSVLFC